MEKTGRKIPITAAKAIANNYGYTQVIIHAFDGETGIQSVATFGKTLDDCKNAADGGNVIKRLMGWPEEMCHAVPARRTKKPKNDAL
jgi:hypothetical protein